MFHEGLEHNQIVNHCIIKQQLDNQFIYSWADDNCIKENYHASHMKKAFGLSYITDNQCKQ